MAWASHEPKFASVDPTNLRGWAAEARKLLTFLIALAVTVGVSASAFAQGQPLLGFPPGVFPTFVTPAASGPVGPPAFTYENTVNTDTSGPSGDLNYVIPFTAASPSSTRFVAVAFQIYNPSGAVFGNIEFNGTTVSSVLTGHNTSQGTDQFFAWGVVPTGTSLTVDVIYSSGQSPCCESGMSMWSANSSQFSSLTPVTTWIDATTDPSVTGTVNVLNGGAVLAFQSEFAGTAGSFAFTTPNTPPVSLDCSCLNQMSGHANNVAPAQSPASVTIDWSGSVSGGAVDLSLAAWR